MGPNEINYPEVFCTCLFCKELVAEYEIAIHLAVCADLNDKLDDIICSVDEDVPDFWDLYECDICDAIVSTHRMFHMHQIFCAEERSIIGKNSVEKLEPSSPEVPRTSIDCNSEQ